MDISSSIKKYTCKSHLKCKVTYLFEYSCHACGPKPYVTLVGLTRLDVVWKVTEVHEAHSRFWLLAILDLGPKSKPNNLNRLMGCKYEIILIHRLKLIIYFTHKTNSFPATQIILLAFTLQ